MQVVCTYGCGLVFDDAIRDTGCPHRELIGPYATPQTEQGRQDQQALKAVIQEFTFNVKGEEPMQDTQNTQAAQKAEPIIEGPKLEPFILADSSRCETCGFGNGLWYRFIYWLTARMVPGAFQSRFCGGGKPLTEQAPGIEGAVFGAERAYSCAGIFEPHIHMRCCRCAHETLHALPTHL